MLVTSPSGSKTRYFNRYVDSTSADGNITKYFFLGDRLVASGVKSYPALTDAPPSAYRPEHWKSPPIVLFPLAGGVLLLLLVPGRRRISGASLPRAASISILLVASSAPVVLFAGCGQPPIVRHYHLDRLGTTQVVTDYNGNIYRQMRYYAYGEVRARFNGAGNPVSGVASDARYEFTGYETDAFSGLDYAGARFYDPELGHFQSHDPKRQFASPYAYGPGDPINGTDPTGEDFGISLLVIALIAAAAAFLDSYLATGDWGMALASAGLAFVGTYVGAGVGWVINAGLKAVGNAALTLAVRATQIGYAAYGVGEGFKNGRPFSAGVSIGTLAYGLSQGNGEGGKAASGTPGSDLASGSTADLAAAQGSGDPTRVAQEIGLIREPFVIDETVSAGEEFYAPMVKNAHGPVDAMAFPVGKGGTGEFTIYDPPVDLGQPNAVPFDVSPGRPAAFKLSGLNVGRTRVIGFSAKVDTGTVRFLVVGNRAVPAVAPGTPDVALR